MVGYRVGVSVARKRVLVEACAASASMPVMVVTTAAARRLVMIVQVRFETDLFQVGALLLATAFDH